LNGDLAEDPAPADGRPIADLLRANKSITQVDLVRFIFTEELSFSNLCDGIAHAHLESLSVYCCTFVGSPHIFARAIAASQGLQNLEVSFVSFRKESDNVIFLGALVELIPQLENLCHFHFETDNAVKYYAVDAERAGTMATLASHMAALIRALGQRPQLESFAIDARGSFANLLEADAFDEALAACLRCSHHLECVKVDHSFSKAREYPMLYEALKTNYTLQNFRLDQLDPDTAKNLLTLLMLNRAGRGYLAKDATDKGKAVQVLENVKDNLDCLFTHLCESPAVCDRLDICNNTPGKARHQGGLLSAVKGTEIESQCLPCDYNDATGQGLENAFQEERALFASVHHGGVTNVNLSPAFVVNPSDEDHVGTEQDIEQQSSSHASVINSDNGGRASGTDGSGLQGNLSPSDEQIDRASDHRQRDERMLAMEREIESLQRRLTQAQADADASTRLQSENNSLRMENASLRMENASLRMEIAGLRQRAMSES
jgi:hypothetical protein